MRSSFAVTVFVYALVTGAACAPAQQAPAPQARAADRPDPARVLEIETASSSSARDLRRFVMGRRWDRLEARNLHSAVSLPETLIANRIKAWRRLPVGERVARWARLFASRNDNVYCFGPKPGGYTAESLLVQDYKFDCVSLFYRTTELAQASSARQALHIAFDTRFKGVDLTRWPSPTGAVSYDDSVHLDYSEDMLRTGIWGREVTADVGVDIPDAAGSSRYAPGSYAFIPKDNLRYENLKSGDLLYFVLDEKNEKARTLREKYGLLVGHQGIVDRDGDTVYLIHAAQSDLPGVYTGNRVVRVPLRTYLDRVERFKGLMVSRLEATPETRD